MYIDVAKMYYQYGVNRRREFIIFAISTNFFTAQMSMQNTKCH